MTIGERATRIVGGDVTERVVTGEGQTDKRFSFDLKMPHIDEMGLQTDS